MIDYYTYMCLCYKRHAFIMYKKDGHYESHGHRIRRHSSSEHEVHISDTTGTDNDDIQPFALPKVVAEPTDGHLVGNLPLAVIPAPVPPCRLSHC